LQLKQDKMELKILNESQNPLFNRKEVFASTESSITPSNDEVLTALAEEYSVEKNAIRIDHIKGKFGSNEFTITANVYPSNEERDNVEKLTKKEKETEKKAAEEAAKPAEEEKPAEEVPKEEPVPAVEETGSNPVEEAKKVEEKKAEEDKKEKDKTPEEKQTE